MTAKNPIIRITCYSTNDTRNIDAILKYVAAEVGAPYDHNPNPPTLKGAPTYQISLCTREGTSVRDIATAALRCRKIFAELCEETAHIGMHILDPTAPKHEPAVVVDPALLVTELGQKIFDSRQGINAAAFDNPASDFMPAIPFERVVRIEFKKLKIA